MIPPGRLARESFTVNWAGVLLVAVLGGTGEEGPAVRLLLRGRAGEVRTETRSCEVELSEPGGKVIAGEKHRRSYAVHTLEVKPSCEIVFERKDLKSGKKSLVAFSREGRLLNDPAPPPVLERLWPVLPGGAIRPGESFTSERMVPLTRGAFRETEEVTLKALEGPPGRRIAVFHITRSAHQQARVCAVRAPVVREGAFSAPKLDFRRVLISVVGATGSGELRFDLAAGRVISFKFEEVLSLAASWDGRAAGRVVKTVFELSCSEPEGRAGR